MLPTGPSGRCAVLTSGGLDSCVLLAELALTNTVTPVYVRFGLAWEDQERAALERFLAAVARPSINPLVTLELPARPIYGEHWSTTGENVPGYDAPDSAVFLPGRNVFLIGLTAVWCSINGVTDIAIGSLDENPFPDATPQFFKDYAALLSGALDFGMAVWAPFRGRHKHEIIAAHADLPLELTLTCMNPRDGRHCGNCNKCAERHAAFERAGVPDRTEYTKAPR